jgi:hypothetical protein
MWEDHQGVSSREFISFRVGRALRKMVCDDCGKPIEMFEMCCAITVYMGDGYQRWEHEYIIHK